MLKDPNSYVVQTGMAPIRPGSVADAWYAKFHRMAPTTFFVFPHSEVKMMRYYATRFNQIGVGRIRVRKSTQNPNQAVVYKDSVVTGKGLKDGS